MALVTLRLPCLDYNMNGSKHSPGAEVGGGGAFASALVTAAVMVASRSGMIDMGSTGLGLSPFLAGH